MAWTEVEPTEPGTDADAECLALARAAIAVDVPEGTLSEGVRVAGATAPFDLASVQDPNFTGGLDPVEYISRLHDGTLDFGDGGDTSALTSPECPDAD